MRYTEFIKKRRELILTILGALALIVFLILAMGAVS